MKTCLRGHQLTDANLYVAPNGRKRCIACRRLGKKARLTTRPIPPISQTELAKTRGLQRLVRIPGIRPGDRIRLGNGHTPPDLQGKVRTVKTLAFTITAKGQKWNVILEDGRCVEVASVEAVL